MKTNILAQICIISSSCRKAQSTHLHVNIEETMETAGAVTNGRRVMMIMMVHRDGKDRPTYRQDKLSTSTIPIASSISTTASTDTLSETNVCWLQQMFFQQLDCTETALFSILNLFSSPPIPPSHNYNSNPQRNFFLDFVCNL